VAKFFSLPMTHDPPSSSEQLAEQAEPEPVLIEEYLGLQTYNKDLA
jgi:hypothetical protein